MQLFIDRDYLLLLYLAAEKGFVQKNKHVEI